MKKVMMLFSTTILVSLIAPMSASANINSLTEVQNHASESAVIVSGEDTGVMSFIETIGPISQSVAEENGLFASVMIAQAVLESGSGSSGLSQQPYNNLFGIKGSYKGAAANFATMEQNTAGEEYQIQDQFRRYPGVKESLEDYAALLKNGIQGDADFYQQTWKEAGKSYQSATEALTGTYATDVAYGQKLNKLIEEYQLTKYDEAGISDTDDKVAKELTPYDGVNYDKKNHYAAGHSTQYVYNRVTQLGGSLDLDLGNGGDWGEATKARGYQLADHPKVGTIVVFPKGVLGAHGEYGHVAFIEKVNPDNSFEISEMNFETKHVISTRMVSGDQLDRLTFINPK